MKPEITEKIERYLNEEMQPEERKDFELQLSADKELSSTLELYNNINKTMSATPNEDELKQTLQQMNRKYFTAGGNVRRGNFRNWFAAAAAVLIIVFGVLYFLLPGKPNAEKLYARFADPAPLNIQLRGSTIDSLAQKAAIEFNNKNYDQALPLLEACLQQQPDDIQMTFSEAICYLETGRYSDAEKIFLAFAISQTAYAESAKWWLALSALRQKDYSRCRNNLNNISQTSPYYIKAKELLKALPD